MDKIILLSESTYDYKYSNIIDPIEGIQIVEGGLIALLKVLLRKKAYYHIRYVKYKGPFLTLFRLILVYLFTLIRGSKIIWSCHNIYEHNFPSRKYNDVVRNLLCRISSKIVVFHEDLVKYLPEKYIDKIVVSSFGSFEKFVKIQTQENKDFQTSFDKWLTKNNISAPDIVSISTAKRNNLPVLINGNRELQSKVLIIAPGVELNLEGADLANTFFYCEKFVKKEVYAILTSKKRIVGFIGHDNISVPTSIYMYASFGIPVIVLDANPSNSIVAKYRIGEILQGENVKSAYDSIIGNYEFYSKNCELFLNDNSWENASLTHKRMFELD